MPGRSTQERGREEGEVDEDSGEEESGVKSLKKWLQASRGRQACTMVSRRPYKDQLGKVSREVGIVHKSKMKERRKAGEKGIRWHHSGMKSKNGRTSWNEEGWKRSFLLLHVMQKVLELVVHERMSQGRGVKGLKEKKKVPGWSVEEMREKPNLVVEEDTEEMRKSRGLSQRNGPTYAERIRLKEWKRKSWTSTL